jgi:hypothetical protein
VFRHEADHVARDATKQWKSPFAEETLKLAVFS